jgi:hypothetical protein
MAPSGRENPACGNFMTNLMTILREEGMENNFILVEDNPSDPFVVSKDGFTQNQLNLITRGLVAPQAIIEMQKVKLLLILAEKLKSFLQFLSFSVSV